MGGNTNVGAASLDDVKPIETIISHALISKLVTQFHNSLLRHEISSTAPYKHNDFVKFEETHVKFLKYILIDAELQTPDKTTRMAVEEFFAPFQLDDEKVDLILVMYQSCFKNLNPQFFADPRLSEGPVRKIEFVRPFLIGGYKSEWNYEKSKDKIVIKVDETVDNLYNQIGGKYSISLIVRRVAHSISRDPSMESIVQQTTVKFLETMFTKFLSQAIKGGEILDSATIEKMKAGHKKVGLAQHHYEIFRNYLAKAVHEFDLPEATITKLLAVFEPLKQLVVSSLVESASQASMGNSLFDQIGGNSAISVVVDYFMKNVSDDAILAPLFKKVDIKRITQIQNRFIALVLQDRQIPVRSLEAMKKAHKKLNMDDEDFDAVKNLFKKGFQTLAVMNPQVLNDIMDSLEKFRADIIGDA